MIYSMKKVKTLSFSLLLFSLPVASHALDFNLSWDDLWFTPNQQAAKLLHRNEPAKAAEKFTIPLWKGVANYKAGQYDKAAADFLKSDTPPANYNRGNALAKMGQYESAIQAYDKVLQQQPDFADAAYNKKLVEELLKKQKKEEQKPNKQHDKNDQSKNQNNSQKNSKNNSQNDPKKNSEQNPENKTQQKKNQNKDKNESAPKQSEPGKNKRQQVKQLTPPSERLTPRQEQALKQWLQQIPDNPGGLLRQKFLRDHLRLQAEKMEGIDR